MEIRRTGIHLPVPFLIIRRAVMPAATGRRTAIQLQMPAKAEAAAYRPTAADTLSNRIIIKIQKHPTVCLKICLLES